MSLVLAAACGAGEQAQAPRTERTVSALDVADGEWIALDLTDPDLIVYFDHAQGPIDYGHIALVCPNGQSMPLDFWIEFESRRLHQPARIIGAQMILLAGEGPGADEQDRDEQDACLECHECPDGLTFCRDLCEDSDGRGAEEPWRGATCPYAGCDDSPEDTGPLVRDDGLHPDWNDLWGTVVPDEEGSAEDDEPRSGESGGFAGGDGDHSSGSGEDDDDDDDDDDSGGWDPGFDSGWGSGGGGGGGTPW